MARKTGTVAVPCSPAVILDGCRGRSFYLVLTCGAEIQAVNMQPGELYTLTMQQDSVGGYGVIFGASIKNAAFPAPAAGAKTKQIFDCEADGSLNAASLAVTS